LNFDRIHDDTVEGSYGSGGNLIYFKSTSGDLVIKWWFRYIRLGSIVNQAFILL
jgi:hypothetical protein